MSSHVVRTFLWFDRQAEEAARLYTSLVPGSRILDELRTGDAGPGPKGQVLTIEFELAGQRFTALNGGPHFAFNEAISIAVAVEGQAEVDRLWNALIEGGGAESQCGWLKDKFGLSWQIVPTALPRLLGDPDPAKSARVMKAMMGMRKLDVAALEAAAG
jgi:predicted 3-demethylubiquinone-9 3-methyltransferase (glyoxalase superfamily)